MKMKMNADQIEQYVRAHGRKVTVVEEAGGPVQDEYVRLGNLQLWQDEKGGVLLVANNRRVVRTKTGFVQNEPVAAGAQVIIKNTLPEFPF